MADSGFSGRPQTLPVNADGNRVVNRLLSQKRIAGAIREDLQEILRNDRDLANATSRLGLYLSATIRSPFSREPLFIVAVREGLRRYQKADSIEHARQEFIVGALSKAAFVLRYNLVNAEGRWDPVHGEPLTYWLKKNLPETGSESADPEWKLISINAFMGGMFHRLVDEGAIEPADDLKEYV